MRKKLNLDVEGLAVDSFETEREEKGRGTVEAQGAGPCTCALSCACNTARYKCGQYAFTEYSCNYTGNDSCLTD